MAINQKETEKRQVPRRDVLIRHRGIILKWQLGDNLTLSAVAESEKPSDGPASLISKVPLAGFQRPRRREANANAIAGPSLPRLLHPSGNLSRAAEGLRLPISTHRQTRPTPPPPPPWSYE